MGIKISRNIKRISFLFLASVILLALTHFSSGFFFGIAKKLYNKWVWLDADGAYLLITIHHIFQAIFGLVLIFLIVNILKKKFSDFGFNFNKFKYSIKAVLIFCGIWFCIQFIVGVLLVNYGGVPVNFGFPLTKRNYISYFLFEILLSGTSEEILFRALVITVLLLVCKKLKISEKNAKIISVSIATLIFMIAHINFTFSPFSITYINYLQQATCMVFGLFYGILFIKTKSVVGVILAHNLLNGIITIVSLLLIKMF